MPGRDTQGFDLDEGFVVEPEDSTETSDGTDYDGLLARVDRRARAQGKRGKAAWSRLEEVLADRKLEKELKDVFEDEDIG